MAAATELFVEYGRRPQGFGIRKQLIGEEATRGGTRGGHTQARRGPLLVGPGGCLATLCAPSRRLFAYKNPSDLKVTEGTSSIHEKFRSSTASRNKVLGDRSLCSGILPGRGIAPGTISINSTASNSTP